MVDINQLRTQQEQRLAPALQAWNLAKQQLEAAIQLTETREREYKEMQEDVRRKLDALELVLSLAGQSEQSSGSRLIASENRSLLMLAESVRADVRAEVKESEKPQTTTPESKDLNRLDGAVRTSSRPLFQFKRAERPISILQEP
jgi:hypothetical protein